MKQVHESWNTSTFSKPTERDAYRKASNVFIWLAGAAILLIWMVGCASDPTPRTKISYNPATGQFSIESPKNTTLNDFNVEMGSNGVRVSIGSYQSITDPNVVGTAWAGQADSIRASGEVFQKGVQQGIEILKAVPK